MTINNVLELDINAMFLSAKELARASGARKPQLIYWAKADYLDSHDNGYYMFPMSQVPKARVMAVLVNKVGMDAERAAKLSTKLLDRHADDPDVAEAVLVFLDALYDRFDDVMRLMIGTKFHKALLHSLVKADEGSEPTLGEVVDG